MGDLCLGEKWSVVSSPWSVAWTPEALWGRRAIRGRFLGREWPPAERMKAKEIVPNRTE